MEIFPVLHVISSLRHCYEHRLSHRFNNQFSFQAPGLFNLAWEKEINWDGGINHIEVQPLAPLLDPGTKPRN